MNDTVSLAAELESTLHDTIPLTTALQVAVASWRDGELVLRAPLAPNRNIHGTAFAGSLYSIAALTGWGSIWLALRSKAVAARIVVATSNIDYRKAVSDEIVCRCTLGADAVRALADQLAAARRATVTVTCTIGDGAAPAVVFNGEYVIARKRDV